MGKVLAEKPAADSYQLQVDVLTNQNLDIEERVTLFAALAGMNEFERGLAHKLVSRAIVWADDEVKAEDLMVRELWGFGNVEGSLFAFLPFGNTNLNGWSCPNCPVSVEEEMRRLLIDTPAWDLIPHDGYKLTADREVLEAIAVIQRLARGIDVTEKAETGELQAST